MPDQRFFGVNASLSDRQLAVQCGIDRARVCDCGVITRIAGPGEEDLSDAIIFIDNADALDALGDGQFGLCLTSAKFETQIGTQSGPVWVVDNPKLAFAMVADGLHFSLDDNVETGSQKLQTVAGAHPTAIIAASAQMGEGVKIGPNAYIGEGVVLGAGVTIGPNVSVTHAIIGEGVVILAGARIGQAGFGFASDAHGKITRIPQLGRVFLGNGVEVGANTTIDRGALSDTRIGDDTKIDNLVQIGHNVVIGRNCIIAAQAGISGSCVIGDGVLVGGQVGFADHLQIGSGAQIAARAGLMRDVPSGEKWGGIPARPVRQWLREMAALEKLGRRKK